MLKGSNRGQEHIYVFNSNFWHPKVGNKGKNLFHLTNFFVLLFVGKLKAIVFYSVVRQLLSFYFRFYKVNMLDSTNATGERRMRVYF
jgi:hypothetical protein